MKRFLLVILIILYAATVNSQSISVSSFKRLDSDLTANTAGTMEQDQNGEVAALIKVVTTQTGFTFDGGAMGVVKTKQTPGEIWVYVPRGSKKITIKHPQLGVLRDYYYPVAINAARTYEMTLVTGSVQTIVKHTSNNQYLVIKVNPSDAVVELDNEILPTSDGIAQKFVKLGTYDYRIQAQDYHVAAGKVTVDDPNSKKILEINLKPAFGWIEISANDESVGAQVFIDNRLAGTIPMKSKNLSSGEHNVKIVKELYNPYSQTVKVRDNETTQITPNLSANFSEVTITVDNDADIFVNDEKKGNGMWTGKLASGTYLLEAKKENNRSTSKTVEISSSHKTYNVQLDAPTPIYGEINITSIPAISDIYIDEKYMGQSPLLIPNIIIGRHDIIIKHDGYADYNKTVLINEVDITQISANLVKNYSQMTNKLDTDNDNQVKRKKTGILLSQNLSLNKVIRRNKYIELRMTYYANKGEMLSISPHLYIKIPNDNKKYEAFYIKGIPISPDKMMIESDKDISFILRFPPPPNYATEIDFINPDTPWQIHRIAL